MKPASWFYVIRPIILLGAALLALSACKKSPYEVGIAWRKGMYEKLKPNLALPLIDRVQLMPAEQLKGMRDHDREIGILNTEAYAPRALSADERKLMLDYVDQLPPAHRRIFSEKLMAIYFLDNFAGAGATDLVMDGQGRPYYYLVLNSAVLKKPIDEWLSYKDNGLFDDASASPSVRVRTGTDYKALMYALLHEGGHMVDYELGISPYMDDFHRKAYQRSAEASPFSEGAWLKIDTPQPGFDFKHRRDVNIYRIFPKKGLIPRAELPGMFAQLSATPFASFYAGTTWCEDFADFVTYHHLEQALGAQVRIELVEQGKVIAEHAPTQTSWSRRRAELIQVLYR